MKYWRDQLYSTGQAHFIKINRTIRILVIVMLFSIAGSSAYAADPTRYSLLTVEDGLPASNVTSITQDKQGYIWFGTIAGLSRYDGINMHTFGIQDGLPNINIRQLFEDGSGRIWVRSDGPICYIKDGKVHIPAIAEKLSRTQDMVSSPNGNLWLLSAASVLSIPAGADFESPDPGITEVRKEGITWNNPRVLGYAADTLWLYNGDSLSGSLISCTPSGAVESFPLRFAPDEPAYFNAALLSGGNIIYNAKEGLVLFHKHRGQQLLLSRSQLGMFTGSLRAMTLDNSKRLWLADANAGMKFIQLVTGKSADSVRIQGFPVRHNVEGNVTHFMQDRERNIWFLTNQKGVGFIPGNASFVRNLNRQNGLSEDVVLALESEFDQNVWIGHQNGKIEYLNYTGIGGIRPVPGNSGNSPVLTLKKMPDGSILAGSRDGLYRVEYGAVAQLGPIKNVNTIERDASGTVYIGTANYLYRFEFADLLELDKFKLEEDIPRSGIIANKAVKAICAGEGENCWYGSNEGLFHFDGFETVNIGRGDQRLSGAISDVVCIKELIAVATRGNGVLLINKKGEISALDKVSGLPSNVCSDLFVIDDSTMWVATNRGIVKLQGSDFFNGDFRYIAYDSKDGMITNEVNSILSMRNTLYLGTSAGLSIFRESDFRTDDVAPGIYLRQIAIGEKDTLLLESYRVPYAKNSLAVRYSGIAFNSGNLIQYRYRLNGLNDKWITTSTDEIRYSSLLPGKYRFEVMAINKDGLASTAPAGFDFIIGKPVYQRWWFIMLVMFTVIALIYISYRVMLGHYERKSLKRSVSAKTMELDHKIRELRRSNDELEQFAYIASHDLKEPLRNIANYIQLIKKRYHNQLDTTGVEYMGFAVNGVKRMYEMIDGLLSYSGLVNQDTSVSTVNLNELVDEVIFDVVHDDAKKVIINKHNLPIVSAHPKQIRELLNNLIDNGIKFNRSEQPVIGIEGVEREEEYEILVTDNGIGLDEQFRDKVFQIFEQLDNSFSKPGSGIGLALCKKIVERHGGRIWYTSGQQGSTFHFTLKKHIQSQTA